MSIIWTAEGRGIVEVPRELPGLLIVFVLAFAGVSGRCENRQRSGLICASVGMIGLGLLSPDFSDHDCFHDDAEPRDAHLHAHRAKHRNGSVKTGRNTGRDWKIQRVLPGGDHFWDSASYGSDFHSSTSAMLLPLLSPQFSTSLPGSC